MAQVLRIRIAEEAVIELRTRSYALGDTIRIRFRFQFTGEADLGEEILVIFAQDGSDETIALEGTISKIAVVPRQGAPGESITYEATVSGLVVDVEPGEYRCTRIVIIDEEGPAWPFTNVDKMDLVIVIREKPAYELWVVESHFVFDLTP